MLLNDKEYLKIVEQIKGEIAKAQYKATLSVNRELILLYYNIGKVINENKTWGNKFIDNLAKDIKLSYPDSTGYSVRNLKYMAKFAENYPNIEFVQQVAAQIPWGHKLRSKQKWDLEFVRNVVVRLQIRLIPVFTAVTGLRMKLYEVK